MFCFAAGPNQGLKRQRFVRKLFWRNEAVSGGSDKISSQNISERCFVGLNCWAIVSLYEITPDVESREELEQNQRPLFLCHAVGKWWGQSAPCGDKQSPVGLLILRQYVHVMFRYLLYWELQVGFSFLEHSPHPLVVLSQAYYMKKRGSGGVKNHHVLFSKLFFLISPSLERIIMCCNNRFCLPSLGYQTFSNDT